MVGIQLGWPVRQNSSYAMAATTNDGLRALGDRWRFLQVLDIETGLFISCVHTSRDAFADKYIPNCISLSEPLY